MMIHRNLLLFIGWRATMVVSGGQLSLWLLRAVVQVPWRSRPILRARPRPICDKHPMRVHFRPPFIVREQDLRGPRCVGRIDSNQRERNTETYVVSVRILRGTFTGIEQGIA